VEAHETVIDRDYRIDFGGMDAAAQAASRDK
jgi:hypothetical protein